MFKYLLGLMLLGVTIVLVGVYLAPDDLQRCSSAPDKTGEQAICQPVDAIVAVSGGDTTARTAEAVDLYRRGWAPLLIFSGAAADKTGPSNAHAMREYALSEGVPDASIIIEGDSETTHENAKLSRGVFVDRQLSRIILVTSGYHQRRASIEFRKVAGIETTIINHPVARDNQWSQWWWLTPHGWWLAVSEITKILLVYLGVSR